jgi:uncharacterized lipoprotein YajG
MRLLERPMKLALLASLFLLLAGCAGPGATGTVAPSPTLPATAGDAAFDDGTGAIRG